ncbi:hypothetical protein ScPMuIL_000454 [Solemya velum]
MDPNQHIFSQNSAFLQQFNNETIQEPGRVQPQQSLLKGSLNGQDFIRKQQPRAPMSQSVAQPVVQVPGGMNIRYFTPPQAVAGNGIQNPPVGLVRFPGQTILQNTLQSQVSVPNPYYRKWRRLEKIIKDIIFINASVCDEVVTVEERIAKIKEERRFLLRKLLHYQSLTEGSMSIPKQMPTGNAQKAQSSSIQNPETPEGQSVKPKSKKKVSSSEKKKVIKDVTETLQPKQKKGKVSGKRVVPPIPLDILGRPVFPLQLGSLTIHSVGEIVTDRSGFNSAEHIYPVGFCSTRVYASITNPEKKCLYTCKISSYDDKYPEFEISPEDNSGHVFDSNSIDECHSDLLKSLTETLEELPLSTTGKGGEFFGLSHPIVQNLIQSCPGSRKCSSYGYKWIRFEVNKSETVDSMAVISQDPAINFDALKSLMSNKGSAKSQSHGLKDSSSLRSLLTSRPLSSSAGKT